MPQKSDGRSVERPHRLLGPVRSTVVHDDDGHADCTLPQYGVQRPQQKIPAVVRRHDDRDGLRITHGSHSTPRHEGLRRRHLVAVGDATVRNAQDRIGDADRLTPVGDHDDRRIR